MIKHTLAFLFYGCLGLLLGAVPGGLLYSHLSGDWGKEAPLVGAVGGAACSAAAYVAVALRPGRGG